MAIHQRADWFGERQQLSPAWTLRKGHKKAECAVWSHQFGWELRLSAGTELLQSQVVSSQKELVEVCMGWRDAMIAKGWQPVLRMDDIPDDAWICEQHPDQP
jgi:hypothetical protein